MCVYPIMQQFHFYISTERSENTSIQIIVHEYPEQLYSKELRSRKILNIGQKGNG